MEIWIDQERKLSLQGTNKPQPKADPTFLPSPEPQPSHLHSVLGKITEDVIEEACQGHLPPQDPRLLCISEK